MGSGFISRDNDDPTAENTFRFMRAAGVDRTRTVIWNTVAGWNGTRAIIPAELEGGIRDLSRLLSLLPRLTTIVLVGRKAERAEEKILELGDYAIFKSAHPSQQVWAGYRDRWEAIPTAWERAAIVAGARRGA